MEFFNSFFPTKTNNNNNTINLAKPINVNTMPTPISQYNTPSNTEEPLIPPNIEKIYKLYDSSNIYDKIISEYYTINPEINRDIPFITDIYDFSNQKFIEYENLEQIRNLIKKMHTPTESNELTKVQIYYDLLTELEKNASGICNYFEYDEYDTQHLGGSYVKKTNFSDCLPELIKYSIYLRYLKDPSEIISIKQIDLYLTDITKYIQTLKDYESKLKS